MRVYPRSATRWFVCYIVAIAPAGDADFVRMRTTWWPSGPGVRP
jgi:hypothetical protein